MKSAKEIYDEWRAGPLTPIGGPEWEDLLVDDPVRVMIEEEAAAPGTMAKRQKAKEMARKRRRRQK